MAAEETFTCPECGTEMIRSPLDPGFLMHVEPTDCAPEPWPTPYTREEIEAAQAEIRRAVMVRFGGDLIGPALTGVEVGDEDAIRYLDGASIDQLLEGGAA